MTDENKDYKPDFPDPEDFESYDEVDSEDGQAELPEDSFDESAATDEEHESGCCLP
jgi:hypothetical protein